MDQERWYAEQLRRAGDPGRLRQLYVDRGGHCSLSAAEEIVTLRTLLTRVETGPWPDTGPARLNAAAGAFTDAYHNVLDFGTGQAAPMPPAFVQYTPPRPLRPSR